MIDCLKKHLQHACTTESARQTWREVPRNCSAGLAKPSGLDPLSVVTNYMQVPCLPQTHKTSVSKVHLVVARLQLNDSIQDGYSSLFGSNHAAGLVHESSDLRVGVPHEDGIDCIESN